MERYVTHLEAAIDGTQLDPDLPQTLHEGRPLWVRYDLEQVAKLLTKRLLKERSESMWRYRELLPIGNLIPEVTLGEKMSPLLACPNLSKQLGMQRLWVKDESQLPTGSFKSRGLAMALTMVRHFGISRVALPTAGNAGGATAAYAARAGVEAFVFMPEDTPIVNQYECDLAGAVTYRVNGLINDCGRIVREGIEAADWFDLSTLKEPYRIEGKKTMGLELAEQTDWDLPDVIFYPTGGGTGLIGMWKAFGELAAMGWLKSDRKPRMISVQSDGCCPIVRAFEAGERFAEPFQNAATVASGLRVPMAVGDFMILDAVRQSGGRAIAVDEGSLLQWQREAMQAEGIAFCPETAACIGALQQMRESGEIGADERVVIFNTGAAQKYVPAHPVELPALDLHQPIDYDAVVSARPNH